MNTQPYCQWSRREFLTRLVAVGGAGLTGLYAPLAAAEPPLETTRIRIVYDETFPVLCYGPQYVATELLRLEGFEEVSYAPFGPNYSDANVLADGKADITAAWAGDILLSVDRSDQVVALSGLHLGCSEVFASERVRGFSDLKGKKVANYAEGSPEQIWFSMMVAYIGIDPEDIEWVVLPYEEWVPAFTTGDVDAMMMWPPDSLAFREQKTGHVIMNTTTDRPWRDYFCCMVAGNREFVDTHPVAAKRALRAILKAADLCALEPQQAARAVTDAGLPFEYDLAVEVFREIPYAQWREYDPLDTMRFFALRLREIGMLNQSPDALVNRSSDWRHLNELKRELKA